MINRRKAILTGLGAAAASAAVVVPIAAAKQTIYTKLSYSELFAKYQDYMEEELNKVLFEINDKITRNHYTMYAEKFFFRHGHGWEWKVVGDETNNTLDIINENSFVHDVFVKEIDSAESKYLGWRWIAQVGEVKLAEANE